MPKALLSVLFTAARLTSVSYDPQETLQLVLFFPEAMETPQDVQFTFPGLAVSPEVADIVFNQEVGFFETDSTSGKVRSFNRLDAHLTPTGETIHPQQTILNFDVDTGQLRIEQLPMRRYAKPSGDRPELEGCRSL